MKQKTANKFSKNSNFYTELKNLQNFQNRLKFSSNIKFTCSTNV